MPNSSNPQSLNRYSWVRGNPLKYFDPSGHKELGACGYNGEECPSPIISIDNPFPDEYSGMTFDQLRPQDQVALVALGWSPEEWDRENLGNGVSSVTDLSWTVEDPVLWISGGIVGAYKAATSIVIRRVLVGASAQCLLNPTCAEIIYGVSSGGQGTYKEMSGPVGDGLDAHHIIQDAWAKRQAIAGYSRNAAPAIRLTTAQHDLMNDMQYAFRVQYGYSTTFQQELSFAETSLRAVGLNGPEIKMALESAVEYFKSLGVY